MSDREPQRASINKLLYIGLLIVVLVSGAAGLTAVRGDTESSIAGTVDILPPAPRAGHPAPEFTLATLDGESIDLSDYRGRPVILNFWASWCGPCRVEMPHLQEAHSADESEVAVLGVNLTKREGNVEDVPAFLEEFGITFPVVLDVDGQVAQLYEVRGQPASVFIGRDGEVKMVFYGPVNQEFIETQIDELLST